MTRIQASLLAVAAAAALTGCATHKAPGALYQAPTYTDAALNPFIASSRNAVDALVQGIDMAQLGQTPVLVATTVNVNDLSRSAPLGRTLSEMYASRLSTHGFNVIEMKLRGNVYVREGTGELLLSREIRDIASNHNAGLVLVGTFSPATQYTYVSMKLVRTADSRIMRSYDYALPNDRDVQRLLGSNSAIPQ